MGSQMKENNISINRPPTTFGNRTNCFVHIKNLIKRPRDNIRCKGQPKELTERRPNCGLHSTDFYIKDKQKLVIDGYEVIIVNVELKCNQNMTPWCEC